MSIKKSVWISFGILFLISIFSFTIMNSNTKNTKLHYVVRQPKVQTTNPPLLILLHGVGGNEQNLFSFAPELPDNFVVVSARGPLTFGPNSFAWFQVDFSTGKPQINAEQAENARKMIIDFIDDLKTEISFDSNQVYLMGFSQGGIMSYSVSLTAPEKIKGIAVMSGRLLPEIKPFIADDKRLEKLKIFISHGKQDAVLNYQYALDASEFLKTKNLNPEFHSYEEGHTVNKQMFDDVNLWLKINLN
ncbi:alpha/beta hydrolase [Flavobacterium johnsoniae]|uniref:Phospholipase/Carboxylesterase n=1 Tax=Flavobacterium johnsoniae (strain ATCC 17061 / DSM 2064 / JCM 8514 / BCRC 14874 / CCUG 350202 / NBRC 14942 / NCIMB 11054 / UW101) TaxID=376686 RepID=A5FEW5_FLAJ1|nr:alpha/beta fold hydrolase [Flavobacterium johnsoniae]ABQ06260.1 phospholipase/Carboxylesterase [Flavobacterium johnsoniae UW101]OXE98271.1 esterase [Flavobacterium johnsoniae UW101]WQG82007.1 dienelactone hydrolase family protein [Flavobacterium johnsoniae UW101]SHK70200.1 phospholipase/carboxylesterase [Flavobacterium johnsoniae]